MKIKLIKHSLASLKSTKQWWTSLRAKIQHHHLPSSTRSGLIKNPNSNLQSLWFRLLSSLHTTPTTEDQTTSRITHAEEDIEGFRLGNNSNSTCHRVRTCSPKLHAGTKADVKYLASLAIVHDDALSSKHQVNNTRLSISTHPPLYHGNHEPTMLQHLLTTWLPGS